MNIYNHGEHYETHCTIHAPPTSVPDHKETITVHIAMKTLCPYHTHNL